MKVGTVFGEASTSKFTFVFPKNLNIALKNAYVYVDMEDYKVIGKVVDIITENPLLSSETVKFFTERSEIASKISKYLKSERFMFFTAECEVLGEINDLGNDIIPVTKPVETGADVYLLEPEQLEKLFLVETPDNLFPGYIETPVNSTFGDKLAKFSLKGDEIITMHCGIFGMTGMGKTTTTGTLLEELTMRGAKSLIFDPHADYINTGMLRDDIFRFIKEKMSKGLRNFLKQYKDYLIHAWNGWISSNISSNFKIPEVCKDSQSLKSLSFLNKALIEEMCKEIEDKFLLFRLIMFMSILDKKVPNVVSHEELLANLEKFYGEMYNYSFTEFIKKSNIPDIILKRIIKLVLSVFPNIDYHYMNYDKFYILNLISAFAGEEITEAQEDYFYRWFEDLENEEYKGNNIEFLNRLLDKAKSLEHTNRSRSALIRKLEKAISVIRILENANVKPLSSKDFIKEFAHRNGKYSIISNIIFDLTEVSPEIMQRGLLYDILHNAFSKFKSKELSVEKGDFSLTFVIEEASVLIPKSGVEEIDHPASKAARNIVRRVAREGRKMGLGLIIISQKPSGVDNIPVSQCNTLILHRVINPEDLSFVKSVGESISEEDIENLKRVERGVAIITGTALKIRKSLMVKFRHRLSEEGRKHPTPLKNMWKII